MYELPNALRLPPEGVFLWLTIPLSITGHGGSGQHNHYLRQQDLLQRNRIYVQRFAKRRLRVLTSLHRIGR